MTDQNNEQPKVTEREFDRAVRGITNAMADGFAGMNERLSETVRSVERIESSISTIRPIVAEHGVKLANLQREVFDKPRHKKDETAVVVAKKKEDDDDSKPITRRDLNVAVGVGLLVITAVVWLFMTFGPFILEQKGAHDDRVRSGAEIRRN